MNELQILQKVHANNQEVKYTIIGMLVALPICALALVAYGSLILMFN